MLDKVRGKYKSYLIADLYKFTSTGGGSAAPRVAKPDGVVDGIFP